MKSRLPARKERARIARRMGRTASELAEENVESDDVAIRSAASFVAGPIVAAGGGAVVLWWQGVEMTLGHVIAIAAAAGIVSFGLWKRFARRRPG